MSDAHKRAGNDDCDDCDNGERGERGARGKRGKRGPRGHDGQDGRDGLTGPTGPGGQTGSTGIVGSTGPTGNTGPSRLIAAANVRGTDGTLLSSFGFSGSVRAGVGFYQLTLNAPAPANNAVILSVERTGFNDTAVSGGVITVATFSPIPPGNPVDDDFYIIVVDAS